MLQLQNRGGEPYRHVEMIEDESWESVAPRL